MNNTETTSIPEGEWYAYLIFVAEGGDFPFYQWRAQVWRTQESPFKTYPTQGIQWEAFKEAFNAYANSAERTPLSPPWQDEAPHAFAAYQRWQENS